jgi:hypothetical protein
MVHRDLFPSPRGRPSEPADVVATVLVLQALEGRSDREATSTSSGCCPPSNWPSWSSGPAPAGGSRRRPSGRAVRAVRAAERAHDQRPQ